MNKESSTEYSRDKANNSHSSAKNSMKKSLSASLRRKSPANKSRPTSPPQSSNLLRYNKSNQNNIASIAAILSSKNNADINSSRHKLSLGNKIGSPIRSPPAMASSNSEDDDDDDEEDDDDENTTSDSSDNNNGPSKRSTNNRIMSPNKVLSPVRGGVNGGGHSRMPSISTLGSGSSTDSESDSEGDSNKSYGDGDSDDNDVDSDTDGYLPTRPPNLLRNKMSTSDLPTISTTFKSNGNSVKSTPTTSAIQSPIQQQSPGLVTSPISFTAAGVRLRERNHISSSPTKKLSDDRDKKSRSRTERRDRNRDRDREYLVDKINSNSSREIQQGQSSSNTRPPRNRERDRRVRRYSKSRERTSDEYRDNQRNGKYNKERGADYVDRNRTHSRSRERGGGYNDKHRGDRYRDKDYVERGRQMTYDYDGKEHTKSRPRERERWEHERERDRERERWDHEREREKGRERWEHERERDRGRERWEHERERDRGRERWEHERERDQGRERERDREHEREKERELDNDNRRYRNNNNEPYYDMDGQSPHNNKSSRKTRDRNHDDSKERAKSLTRKQSRIIREKNVPMERTRSKSLTREHEGKSADKDLQKDRDKEYEKLIKANVQPTRNGDEKDYPERGRSSNNKNIDNEQKNRDREYEKLMEKGKAPIRSGDEKDYPERGRSFNKDNEQKNRDREYEKLMEKGISNSQPIRSGDEKDHPEGGKSSNNKNMDNEQKNKDKEHEKLTEKGRANNQPIRSGDEKDYPERGRSSNNKNIDNEDIRSKPREGDRNGRAKSKPRGEHSDKERAKSRTRDKEFELEKDPKLLINQIGNKNLQQKNEESSHIEKDEPKSSSGKISAQILIEESKQYKSITLTPDMTALDVMTLFRSDNTISDASAWTLFEFIDEFKLERPLRDWESVAWVIKTWESGRKNSLILRKYAYRNALTLAGFNERMPLTCGWLFLEVRKKWQKRYIHIKDGSLYHSKDYKGTNEVFLCSMISFDVFVCTKSFKTFPTEFAFAIKSQDKITMFENPENDYMHYLCADHLELMNEWLIAIRMAKNKIMRETSPELFVDIPVKNEKSNAPINLNIPLTNVLPAAVSKTTSLMNEITFELTSTNQDTKKIKKEDKWDTLRQHVRNASGGSLLNFFDNPPGTTSPPTEHTKNESSSEDPKKKEVKKMDSVNPSKTTTSNDSVFKGGSLLDYDDKNIPVKQVEPEQVTFAKGSLLSNGGDRVKRTKDSNGGPLLNIGGDVKFHKGSLLDRNVEGSGNGAGGKSLQRSKTMGSSLKQQSRQNNFQTLLRFGNNQKGFGDEMKSSSIKSPPIKSPPIKSPPIKSPPVKSFHNGDRERDSYF